MFTSGWKELGLCVEFLCAVLSLSLSLSSGRGSSGRSNRLQEGSGELLGDFGILIGSSGTLVLT